MGNLKYRKLDKEFYLQPCLQAAKGLIGKLIVRKKNNRIYSGIISETEAYLSKNDEASHSYRGLTRRNEAMFKIGGTVYVYFTYGNHYCLNVVTGRIGIGEAILIRAIEPLEGIEYMKANRNCDDVYNLCSGPGKLTQAMEIDKSLNGESFLGNTIFICNYYKDYKPKIISTNRIGINKNKDAKYRFIDINSKFLSRKLN